MSAFIDFSLFAMNDNDEVTNGNVEEAGDRSLAGSNVSRPNDDWEQPATLRSAEENQPFSDRHSFITNL